MTFICLLVGCASYVPAPLDAPVRSADAPTAVLSPNALAVIAVLENPDLKAQRAKLGVTDAQVFAARLLPDPVAQASFDKRLGGPDPFNGFGGQLALDLNQLRLARTVRAAGEAAKRQVRLDLAWAEWQVAEQAKLQGVRVLALTTQSELARAGAEAAQAAFLVSSRAAGRGDLAAGDLDTRRGALLDATTRARTTESDLIAARYDLNRQLGLPPASLLRLAAPGPPPVPPTAEVLTAQAIARRLDLQALRAGYAAAEADVHKAVLEQFPNLSLAIAYARDTAGNRTLGPQLSFTLPLWNRNRGGIAIARATRGQLRAEYDARLFQTRAQIAVAVAGVLILRRQSGELRAQLPALMAYGAATARAAQRGDLAQATADTAQQAVRDRLLALAQLDQQLAEQTIALELLSGGPSEGWTR